ncbi:hypothetical protein G7Y89_g12123 [Cudoniella acicularis]|uniref:SH3 domain-containing protein n=1 Tax=Cudoniella acicularis TaxID=354080 RepID=A0A8H4RB22_9HELO|nr:hypothetical protein G7Y89_g12123 [Cudoniella acicularis]
MPHSVSSEEGEVINTPPSSPSGSSEEPEENTQSQAQSSTSTWENSTIEDIPGTPAFQPTSFDDTPEAMELQSETPSQPQRCEPGNYIVLYDFTAQNENELSMKEGEIIRVSYEYGKGYIEKFEFDNLTDFRSRMVGCNEE